MGSERPSARRIAGPDLGTADTIRAEPTPHVRSYPQWLYLALTAVTLGWLLLATAAGIRQTDQPYPVTGYAMFSHPTDGVRIDLVLDGTTATGLEARLAPQDFGLTELQLRSFIIDHVGPAPDAVRPDAQQHVAALAEVWSERQGAELDELEVSRVARSADREEPEEMLLESWSR